MNRWAAKAPAASLGALFLVAIALQAHAVRGSWGAAYWLHGTVASAAVCALALARRRAPTRTAVAGVAVAAVTVAVGLLPGVRLPAEPGPAMVLGLAVLIASAVRTLPPARAAALAVAGVPLIAGQLAARPSSAVAAIAATGWLAAVAVGLWARAHDDRVRATADGVRRAERLELARELHDVVAHHITGMLIEAQAAQVVARRDPGKVPHSLAEIEAAGTEALAAMRRVVGLLRDADDAAPASPGPEELSALVERFARQGPEVRLSTPDDPADWPPEVTSTVYRIVQEALTNVLRHATGARTIEVVVARAACGVTVEVADDGSPHPARTRHRGGYGLVGMRERVETLGGSLHAGPRPGPGWSVRATLPVPTPEPP
ncbi:sensor histidine kinase [Streptomyces sp. NPDC047315]|uniref:sensor histidine kinase n=1 Tax=Streptomyces sp. NPDC047315 TaxID=3155142 RepID=UPI0033F3AEC6